MSNLKKIFSNSIFLYAENFIRLGVSVLVSIWTARVLGPHDFGILNFASALMTLFLPLAALGMENPAILRIARGEDEQKLMDTVMGIRVLSGTLCYICAAALVLSTKHGQSTNILVCLAVLVSILGYVPGGLDYWFKAHTNSKYPATARTVATLSSNLGKVVCVLGGLSVLWFGITVAVEAVVAGVGYMIAFRLAGRRLRPLNIDLTLAKRLIWEGLPFLITAFSVLIYMKIDVVMIGYMASDYQNGIYSVAQKLSELLYVVPAVLGESAYPLLIRTHQNKGEAFSLAVQMYGDVLMSVAYCAAIFSAIFGHLIVRLTFGAGYMDSVDVFVVHVWSSIPIVLALIRSRWLAIMGLQIYDSICTLGGAILNVSLNFYLIPKYGAMGAAIATLISYVFASFVLSALIPALRPIAVIQIKALVPFARAIGAVRFILLERKAQV